MDLKHVAGLGYFALVLKSSCRIYEKFGVNIFFGEFRN